VITKKDIKMKQYTGMRKGISLVEMMIAVILFAILATVGLKYNKNYINTELQGMKARTAAAMEQASQLVTGYKLYKTQYGTPTDIEDLNATTTMVMTSLPNAITEMTLLGWDLNTTTGIGSGYAFHMNLDGNTSAVEAAQYCALWNREYNSSVELNVSGTENYGTAAAPTHVAAGSTSYCFGSAADGYEVFVILP
jgi:prepilin-type N-terminal cleavage/methylation domain-containing protein